MDRLEALRLLGYELLEHISAEMIDFSGVRETWGKVVLLGTVDQKRSKSKASWDMYLGHFLLKAKREKRGREREFCFVHQVGNLGLRTDVLCKNRAFALDVFVEHLLFYAYKN